jgi:hypothetical protein
MPIVVQINMYRDSNEEFYLQRCLSQEEIDDIKDIVDSYPHTDYEYATRDKLFDDIYLYLRNRNILYNEITFKYEFTQKKED